MAYSGPMPRRPRCSRSVFPVLVLAAASVAPPAVHGLEPDWVTIGAPGNAPFTGPFPFGSEIMNGRGGVAYEYRIARTEVSTSQWLEFVNTFSTQADFPSHLFGTPSFIWGPANWGAVPDSSYSGPGFRYRLEDHPQAGDRPVGGIGWRDAAIYCNWLHNGKGADPASFMTGAYDATTFGQIIPPEGPLIITDDTTRLPGARYFLPTLDEWAKAAYYDPHRHGPGQGGWWLYPHRSDSPPLPGPPGQGETSAGYVPAEFLGEWDIPLGAYPDSVSPWGLLDTSGGAKEWTETILDFGIPNPNYDILLGGSYAGDLYYMVEDHVAGLSSHSPVGGTYPGGIRLAAWIPSPHCGFVLALLGAVVSLTRRRSPLDPGGRT